MLATLKETRRPAASTFQPVARGRVSYDIAHSSSGSFLQRSCACGGGCPHCAGEAREESTEGMDSGAPASSTTTDQELDEMAPPAEDAGQTAADIPRIKPGWDCQNGGGLSGCNTSTGDWELLNIYNSCCTQPCSIKHEEQHIADFTKWGCCKDMVEKSKESKNKDCYVDTLKKWTENVAKPTTECRAYGVSVKCVEKLEKEKKCKGEDDGPCCGKIRQYKDRMKDEKKKACDAAPKAEPACPTYEKCESDS